MSEQSELERIEGHISLLKSYFMNLSKLLGNFIIYDGDTIPYSNWDVQTSHCLAIITPGYRDASKSYFPKVKVGNKDNAYVLDRGAYSNFCEWVDFYFNKIATEGTMSSDMFIDEVYVLDPAIFYDLGMIADDSMVLTSVGSKYRFEDAMSPKDRGIHSSIEITEVEKGFVSNYITPRIKSMYFVKDRIYIMFEDIQRQEDLHDGYEAPGLAFLARDANKDGDYGINDNALHRLHDFIYLNGDQQP